MSDSQSTEEKEQLEIKLVEFALKAHKLLEEDTFFDDGGNPQEGSELIKSTANAILAIRASKEEEQDT